VVVGVLNTAFSYCIFLVMLALGLHYTLATLVGAVIGLVFSFVTTGTIVFRNQKSSRVVLYAMAQAIGYLVNIGAQWCLHQANLGERISGLIAIVPTVAVVYSLCRWVVFRSGQDIRPG